MVASAEWRESGAGGAAERTTERHSGAERKSTQNTQYDQIGTDYLKVKELPAAEPELPSILSALGKDGVKGARCLDLACGTGKYTHLLYTLGASSVTGYDISSAMIEGALATYPPSRYPTLHFSVADCSMPNALPTPGGHDFDLVFSAWLLNYAGSERELTNMFLVIEQQMAPGGRFVGLTTDVHDVDMHIPKPDFYGLDIFVLEPAYIAPDTQQNVGIKARVQVGKGDFEFDCFQFRADVYERCARTAGLEIRWREVDVPDDERRVSGYWDEWLRRPTFAMLEAKRLM